jgi:hypothetical protein
VGFHVRTGVGTGAPVRIGTLLDTFSDELASRSPSIVLAVSRNDGPFVPVSTGETEVRAGNDPGITGLGPYLPNIPADWWETRRTLELTGTYQFRVRGSSGGALSSWVAGPVFRVRSLQETSPVFSYSSGWTSVTGDARHGGAAEIASTAGAVATATFESSSVAWVALRTPDGGSAEVRVDGVLAGTVSLNQTVWPDNTTPEIVFARTWPEAGTHTITITVRGTPAGSAVNIDELLAIR